MKNEYAFEQIRDIGSPSKYTVKITADRKFTEAEIKDELFKFVKENWGWLITQ